jgi:hypothetical protein
MLLRPTFQRSNWITFTSSACTCASVVQTLVIQGLKWGALAALILYFQHKLGLEE